MADYTVLSFNLATVVAPPVAIAQTVGKEVDNISVLDIPVGASVFIRAGDPVFKDRILLAANRNIRFCPPERNGIFYDNPVAGAGTLQLLISYASGGVEVVNL